MYVIGKKWTNVQFKKDKTYKCGVFFSADRTQKEYLSIEYCPTEDMVADYLTKPLQGDKLKKFRKEIMNLK